MTRKKNNQERQEKNTFNISMTYIHRKLRYYKHETKRVYYKNIQSKNKNKLLEIKNPKAEIKMQFKGCNIKLRKYLQKIEQKYKRMDNRSKMH